MTRKPPKGKSLAEINPELAEQCHPTKNGDLTPFQSRREMKRQRKRISFAAIKR